MRLFWGAIALFCTPAIAGTAEVHTRDDVARTGVELTQQPRLVSTPAPWMRKTEHAGVVYFLYASPPRVERYALATRQWLPSILLSAEPRGFGVSNAGLFVSQSTKVSRFNLDGGGESTLANAWTNADDANVVGPYWVTSRGHRLQSVRITDGTQVSVHPPSGPSISSVPQRFSVAKDAMVLFGWQVGISPLDTLRIAVNPDGSFDTTLSSPYHGTYPAGTVVHADNDGVVITDEAGIAFDGHSLEYRSGTGGPINDMVKVGSNRYVLRSDAVARLNTGFQETGVITLAQEAHALAVTSTTLFLFSGTGVVELALTQFDDPEGHAPPSAMVPFLADSVEMADDGTLFLFHKAGRVIHRFSTLQWRFLPSVSLPVSPLFVSLDKANSRVNVAYEGGRVGVIPAGALEERFLAFGPVTALGMGAADTFVLIRDGINHRTFNMAGIQVGEGFFRDSPEYAWSRVTRRMFHYRSGFPSDLHFAIISESGEITASGESPYHGEVQTDPPIRPSPSGALVYLGSGQVYDGINLTLVDTLPMRLKDAAWLGTVLYTTNAGPNAGQHRLVRWNQNHTVSTEGRVAGSPTRLFTSGGLLVTVADVNGRTVIQRWPASLFGRNVSAVLPQISPATPRGGPLSFTVEFTLHGLEAATDARFDITLSAPISELTWSCDIGLGAFPCGGSAGFQLVQSLVVGETLRVTASGLMPLDATGDIDIRAMASQVAVEVEPADNTVYGRISLMDVVFADGFD